MPDEQENVCCKRVTCVANYTSFHNICLDRDILEVRIKARYVTSLISAWKVLGKQDTGNMYYGAIDNWAGEIDVLSLRVLLVELGLDTPRQMADA